MYPEYRSRLATGHMTQAEHGRCAAGEKSMRMLSGYMHWLTVGLALLVSAQGITTQKARGQAPYGAPMGTMPAGGMPMGGMPGGPMAGGMPGGAMPAGFMTPDAPMSMAFPGPAPGEVVYAGANGPSCDSACGGCGSCGDCCGAGGGGGCGLFGGGCGLFGGGCGGGCPPGGAGNCCLLGDGSVASSLLGPFAPFSEGGCGSPRWFDFYAGTIGLARTSDYGGFQGSDRDPVTGAFFRESRVSSNGISGPIVLQSTQLDMSNMRYGLELAARLQLGVVSALEARYFGLNAWDETATVSTAPNGNLYSIYSNFGVAPPGGFQDTDRSFIHSINYQSELHNGELNFRRQVGSPFCWLQGSILGGVRYFDLDESFRFDATGGNTFTFTDIRTFNMITRTRNQLTGFQIGGDAWVSLIPGVSLGIETKGGIFGNHSESETSTTTTHNAIPTAREFLQDGRTAYLGELVASTVYRLTYSASIKASYNLLYVDNVALAPENFNVRDISNALNLGALNANRFPNLDNDGEVVYQGWSIGAELMW